MKLESGNELSAGIDCGIEGIEVPVHEGHDLAAGTGLVGLKGAVAIAFGHANLLGPQNRVVVGVLGHIRKGGGGSGSLGLAVETSDPGGDLVIHCRAILIATGNLGNSKELHERCVPDFADSYQRKSQHLLPTCTGDGVLMAERAGLPVNLSSIVPSYLGPGCGGPYHPQLMLQPDRADALHVNLDGKRYYNEQQRGEICTLSLIHI